MKLYYAKGTVSVAVAIALEEAGIAYDLARVDFASGEQTGLAYQAINPKGRVPALDTGTGILTETGAILDYIAALAPQAGLVPADPLQAARMREVMYYLASTVHVNHAHKMRGARWATEASSFADMRAKVPETMTVSAAHLDSHCIAGPYVLGDRPSLADAYLFVVASWMPGDGVDVAAFPKLSALLAAMEARDSVKKVRAEGLL